MRLIILPTALVLLTVASFSPAQTKPNDKPALPYCIVGTGQTTCYDDQGDIAPPKPGQAFYGQDAQFPRHPASYAISADGLTVYDRNTGLTWQRSPDTKKNGVPSSSDKLTFSQAKALAAKLNAAKFAGFDDWRLPTVKELYSLILFSGVDSGPGGENDQARPFIDTKYFKFAYGDVRAGERTIDSQWATSTVYVNNAEQMFGVNFADGRIKGYGLTMPGRGDKTFFVICVRGNPAYGKNDFLDNGDGTITDRATGLMWSKADSGKGMIWEEALAFAAKFKLAGHADWRLPNAKELQSIADYTRVPACDPIFAISKLNDGEYPYFWSSTTHLDGPPDRQGGAAIYVAFGRALGWMQFPPGRGEYRLLDVHGAGAQRSDPKAGDPADYPHGRGPQGDVIRIDNYVRCVRDAAK